MTTDKPSKNEDEYFTLRDAELLKKQRAEADAAAREAERRTHYMKCPKDGYDLTTQDFQGVQVDTCSHCGGMWLDAGEWHAIAHEERPAFLDRIFAGLGVRTKRPV